MTNTTTELSPYLQARQKLAAAIDVEQVARQEWADATDNAAGSVNDPAVVRAWDAYLQAGIDRVAVETELEAEFEGELLASAARSQFYAPFSDSADSKEDRENLSVAGYLGPQAVPFRDEWIVWCERVAHINPDFDPGAEFLTD